MKTKQEQIEKMARSMCGYYNDGKCIFRNCAPCDKFNSQECSYKEDSEELYYADYRKADDVRKETAREILSRIKLYATDSKTDLIDLINEIANANGVEVEK